MDTINYFKIKCLLETITKDRLKLILNNNNITYKEEDEDYDNDNNDDDDFNNILKLLLNSSIFKNNINVLDDFQIILNIYTNVYKIKDYKINNQLYDEILNDLSNCLNRIDFIIFNNKSSSINNEINFKLNTLQSHNDSYLNNGGSNDILIINTDNENKANEINEISLDLYKQNKFNESNLKFKEALNLNNISNLIKSTIYLNKSINNFEYHYPHNQTHQAHPHLFYILPNQSDLILLNYSKSDCIKSIINRPNWSLPYFILSRILNRIGGINNFEISIQLCDSAILLDSNNYKDDYLNLKFKIIEKLNLINQSTTSTSINNIRNIENESILILIKNQSILINHFKDYKITNQLLLNEGIELNKIEIYSNKYNVSLSSQIERELSIKAYQYYINNNFDKSILLYTLIIGNIINRTIVNNDKVDNHNQTTSFLNDKSIYADSFLNYIELLILKEEGKGTSSGNSLLILLLLLFCSLFEQSIKINDDGDGEEDKELKESIKNNYGVNIIYQVLGLIYRHGSLDDQEVLLVDSSIDLEKSEYYLLKSIENDNELDFIEFNNKGIVYLAYGYMYYTGNNFRNKIDKEIALQVWVIGSMLINNNDNNNNNINHCLECLKLHFSNDELQQHKDNIPKLEKLLQQ